MRNRTSVGLPLAYDPYCLDEGFPVQFAGHTVLDTPVTWLHIHDCLELGYCHEGRGVFVVEDKVMPFGKGDICVVDRNEAHLAQSLAGTEARWSFVLLDLGRLLSSAMLPLVDTEGKLGGVGFPNVLDHREHPEAAEILRQITDELSQAQDGFRDVVRGLALALAVHLARLVRGREPSPNVPEPTNLGRIAPALAHIASNYQHELRLGVLADLCHASERSVRRWFVDSVRTTPLGYLVSVRLGMAVALLRNTGLPVTDISHQVGYSSHSSFTRQFHERLGMTPTEWRNAQHHGSD